MSRTRGGGVDGGGEPKGPPQACLFVASLSPDTSEDALHELFATHGEVLKIKLMKDRSSRPYAFVQYSSTEEANNALLLTNNVALDGRRLRVEKAKVNRTLFIAKMNRSLTNVKLREAVECYGPVEIVTVIKNHQTQKSKGCGFVKFVFREDAMAAYLGLKNQFRKWVVEWATSSNDPDVLGVDKYNVFVGGLNPLLVTKAALEERFGAYGQVDAVTLINRDEAQENSMALPRNAFAFVRFRHASSSASAIEHENGAEWLERRIRVQYCESLEMKNKRRTQKYFSSLATGGNPYLPGPGPYYATSFPYPVPMMMGGMPVYMGGSGGAVASPQRYHGGGGGGGRYGYGGGGGGAGQQSPSAEVMAPNYYPAGRRASSSAGFAPYGAYPQGQPMAMPLGYSPSWMYDTAQSPHTLDEQGFDVDEWQQQQMASGDPTMYQQQQELGEEEAEQQQAYIVEG